MRQLSIRALKSRCILFSHAPTHVGDEYTNPSAIAGRRLPHSRAEECGYGFVTASCHIARGMSHIDVGRQIAKPRRIRAQRLLRNRDSSLGVVRAVYRGCQSARNSLSFRDLPSSSAFGSVPFLAGDATAFLRFSFSFSLCCLLFFPSPSLSFRSIPAYVRRQ